MAIIYYPSGSTQYVRNVVAGGMVEQFIDVAPNQIIFLSGSTIGVPTDIASASYAQTASVSLNALGGGPYTTLYTSSTNWITVSFLNPEYYILLNTALSYSFTSSDLPQSGTVASTTLFIDHTATATSSLSFPGNWSFMGTTPTYITASKGGVLTIKNYGGVNKTIAAFTTQY